MFAENTLYFKEQSSACFIFESQATSGKRKCLTGKSTAQYVKVLGDIALG